MSIVKCLTGVFMKCRCICGAQFVSKSAKLRHKKSGKCPEYDSKMRFSDLPPTLRRNPDLELLDIIGDDFSDGAYMGLADELGVEL